MAETTVEKTLGELKADFDVKLAEINAAVVAGTPTEALELQLKAIEAEYNKAYELSIFAGITDVEELIRRFDFMALSHKKNATDGVVTDFVEAQRRTMLDIKKFCARREIATGWEYQLEAFGKRVVIRALNQLIADKKVLAAKLKEVDGSIKMSKLAAEIELGKTPHSNTQTVKHLQAIFDTLLPEADCPNIDNYDIARFDAMASKRDKSVKAGVRIANGSSREFREVMMTVFYCKLTGEDFEVVYKKVKS